MALHEESLDQVRAGLLVQPDGQIRKAPGHPAVGTQTSWPDIRLSKSIPGACPSDGGAVDVRVSSSGNRLLTVMLGCPVAGSLRHLLDGCGHAALSSASRCRDRGFLQSTLSPPFAVRWGSGDHWPYQTVGVRAHSDGQSIVKEHDHGK